MGFLSGSWWSFLRRWFGGGYENTWLGNNRGVQTAFMLLSLLVVLIPRNLELLPTIMAVVEACWLQFQFWSRGHYPVFAWKKGNNKPTQEEIDRYNSRWYNAFCLWTVEHKKTHIKWYNKIYIWMFPDLEYSRHYDFNYIMIRYTCPMIPMAFINLGYLLIGALVAPIYLTCDYLENKGWNLFGFSYTQLAEYIVGFVFGYGLWCING